MTLAANLPNASLVCVTETRAGGALKWLEGTWRGTRTARRRFCGGRAWSTWRLAIGPRTATRTRTGTDTAVTSKADSAPKADDEDESCDDESTGVNPRLEAMEWDVLVGSDLVYDDDGVRYLPRVVRHFLRNNEPAYFLYAHTKYRYELRDMALWREFHECGLDVEEVREDGAPSPPSSPEPLTQLFPEKRIAVLRITLREEDK